ncbi:hypothetical protein K1719_026265 [Acacia pycnantha]|nr:hypothetical protein K1719_026265 [Acacia pycnantha]
MACMVLVGIRSSRAHQARYMVDLEVQLPTHFDPFAESKESDAPDLQKYGRSPLSFFLWHRPICKTVSDAANVLEAIAGVDPRDEATIKASKYVPKGGYAQFLRKDCLKGKRRG